MSIKLTPISISQVKFTKPWAQVVGMEVIQYPKDYIATVGVYGKTDLLRKTAVTLLNRGTVTPVVKEA